jgi:hypothetical protein
VAQAGDARGGVSSGRRGVSSRRDGAVWHELGVEQRGVSSRRRVAGWGGAGRDGAG